MADEPARPVFYRVDLTAEQADALIRVLDRCGDEAPELTAVVRQLSGVRESRRRAQLRPRG